MGLDWMGLFNNLFSKNYVWLDPYIKGYVGTLYDTQLTLGKEQEKEHILYSIYSISEESSYKSSHNFP